jgi:hypothetical protein
MTAKRLVRSVSVVLAAAALWGVPITGAQARGYHPNPPREAPAQSDGNSASQPQDSRSSEVSSQSNGGSHEGCFRRYDDRCNRARENRRGHHDGAAN